MINVLAIITAHPGQRDQILAAFHANAAAVRAEAGCLEYSAAVDAEGLPPSFASFGADSFVVIEKWADMAALRAHGKAPHMLAYAAQVKDLTAARAIHVLTPATPV